jgi:hypothetical protein
MFGQSRIARLKVRRCTRGAIGAAALTLVLAFFMTLMIGESQACPPGTTAATAGLSQELKSKAVMTSKVIVTATRSTPEANIFRRVGTCCGGESPSIGSGCSHACCASGAVALIDAASSVAIEKVATDYLLPQGGQVTLANPDPNYRPPRRA